MDEAPAYAASGARAAHAVRQLSAGTGPSAGKGLKPVIGVTGPDRGGFPAWLFTRWALSRSGGRAVRITPNRPCHPDQLDGLVIGGGADISDPLPGEPPDPPPPPSRLRWLKPWLRLLDLVLAPLVFLFRWLGGTRKHGIDRRRDQLELDLLAAARARKLPVLGICRGAQLMSLFEGGALVRDVHTLYEERAHMYTVLPRREVCLAQGSLLREAIGCDELLVNSMHFHAVAEPGKDMRVVAREPGGLPQAVEHVARPFWIGVQWHPEYLPQHETHQRLFRALVATARGRVLATEMGQARST
jgi:putative glutamine amidotransferase